MKLSSIFTAPIRWIGRHFFKLFFVTLLVVGGYFFYLDLQIQQRFSGNKWQVPAQVYARPLVLSLEQEITPAEVLDELALLGYRQVANADEVGEFSVGKDRVVIYRRAFTYADISASERILDIRWQSDRISAIELPLTKQKARRIMLEPWLVSRMVSGLSEDRMLVENKDIPVLLKTALVEVEDKHFYEHHGVNPVSIVRAFLANISAGRTVQGGSTLTQQLVKNLYLTREKSYLRKLQEAAMAIVIDARYDKETILNAYINEVFLGQNGAVAVHGFGLASHFYFNKPLQELQIDEIATLVGMVKGASYYHPRRYTDRATDRRNLVLRVLFEANKLTRNEYESSISKPLTTTKSASLASGKHPAFMEQVRRELNSVISGSELKQSGIKLYTTLDINVQRRAEKAVISVLNRKQTEALPDLEAAMVITDISSGEVRAIVGGKNTEFAGFNRALNAQRPVGSLIKPVVYLTALENPYEYTLASPLKDEPVEFQDAGGKMWRPQNADKTFRGQVPLLEGLTNSLNVPTVNLATSVGIDSIIQTLARLGAIKNVAPLPSVALGAVELSPFEINQVYQTISNNGELRPLVALRAISTHDDKVLWKREEESQQRIDEDATYLLNYALHQVTRSGTARVLSKHFPSVSLAGKTGTTDDYRDSWFAGFDRNLVSSVWIGNDDNQPINMSGASGALQIFVEFQKQQTPKNLSRRFPDSLTIAHFNPEDGTRTTPGCNDDVLSVPAIIEALPANTLCNSQEAVAPSTTPAKKKSWFERIFGED